MKRDASKLAPFSKIFKISAKDVKKYGFFDLTPAVDSPLYIDPKLLTDDIPFFLMQSRFCVKNSKT